MSLALAGSLQLTVGAPLPNIVRSRPQGLSRLWRGQAASALPQLLGAVFTLCGHAHRLVSRQAIAAAQGRLVALSEDERAQLRWHTVREHARRVTLDWAALAGLPSAPAVQALRTLPQAAAGSTPDADALADWLDREVLAMPAAAWRDCAQLGGEGWLADWCAHTATTTALALDAARAALHGVQIDAAPLRLHDQPAVRQRLASDLAGATGDAFVAAPHTAVGCADTGAWSRAGAPPIAGPRSAWGGLASRLVDLSRLAVTPSNACELDSGACTPGAGEGLAWIETARGLLVHWVRLDAGDRVADCRVLSPTDWNFHPEGGLARALAQTRSPAAAEWLVAAFDPCVPHCVVVATLEEPVHA
jgi:hypothetical protein